jgi:hypothetical protein
MSVSSPSSWDARADVNVTSSVHTHGSVVCISADETRTEDGYAQHTTAQTSETRHLEVHVRDQVQVAKFSQVFDWLRRWYK